MPRFDLFVDDLTMRLMPPDLRLPGTVFRGVVTRDPTGVPGVPDIDDVDADVDVDVDAGVEVRAAPPHMA